MPRNSFDIRDAKLLTFEQVAIGLDTVMQDLEMVCPPDNDIDSCLSVNQVLELVKTRLEKDLQESLLDAVTSLTGLPPWAEHDVTV